MAGGPNSSTASSPSAAGDPLKPASSSPPSSLGSQPTTAGKPSIGTKITPSGTAIPNVPGQQKTINNLSPPYGKSPIHDLGPFDNDMSAMQGLPDPGPVNGHPMSEGSVSILMRRLPRNATQEALRSMFLFAKDFIDADFITPDAPEDKGFISAVARFRTSTAAEDAKALLDGKPNFANEANMIVEVMESPLNGGYWTRRKTFDGAVHRGMPGPTFGGPGARQSSRFNGTFQSMERVSPPTLSKSLNSAGTDLPAPEAGGHFQSLFSPKSQINYAVGEQRRVTGKSVINDDTIDDDETGELLKDPVAYAKNGHGNSAPGLARRPTNPSVPVSRFAGLSLATNPISSPPKQSYAAPRGSVSVQSPSGSMPPGSMNVGPGSNYQLASQHYQRHNYPPVNPADQNPPCNTLYVGNLPMDTSEDELKAMFSKQRGYKRLCFRTKQNGPMCFVEFEDISFATKALNELYGHPLHNSVKGGIRLSFSKNPLGVRTGQPGSSSNPSIPLSPQNTFAGINGGLGGLPGQPFSSVNGPPPGLTAPPGLNGSVGQTSGSSSGLTSPIGNPMMGGFRGADFGLNSVSLAGLRGQPVAGGVPTSSANSGMTMGSAFPDYMMGR